MKNINHNQIKTSIVIPVKIFEKILRKLIDKNLEISNNYYGIQIYYVANPYHAKKEYICQKLAEYFGVNEVTDYHLDDEELNTNVWITFEDKKPWLDNY